MRIVYNIRSAIANRRSRWQRICVACAFDLRWTIAKIYCETYSDGSAQIRPYPGRKFRISAAIERSEMSTAWTIPLRMGALLKSGVNRCGLRIEAYTLSRETGFPSLDRNKSARGKSGLRAPQDFRKVIVHDGTKSFAAFVGSMGGRLFCRCRRSPTSRTRKPSYKICATCLTHAARKEGAHSRPRMVPECRRRPPGCSVTDCRRCPSPSYSVRALGLLPTDR